MFIAERAGHRDAAAGDAGGVEELLHEVPLGPPAGSTASVAAPWAARARETLTPLPPGSTRLDVARCTSPRRSASMTMARSMLGLGVRVTITPSPPGDRPRDLGGDVVGEVGVGDDDVDVARSAKRWRWSSPALLESVATSTRRAEATIARLTRASAWSGW